MYRAFDDENFNSLPGGGVLEPAQTNVANPLSLKTAGSFGLVGLILLQMPMAIHGSKYVPLM